MSSYEDEDEDEGEKEYFDSFIDSLELRGWQWIGRGSFRKVYAKDSWVIKVPLGMDGRMDNLVEARAWKKYRSNPTSLGFKVAPCRLLSNDCLLMVKMESINRDTYVSPRINNRATVDNDQVGMYKGQLVAYDYALDIPERISWEQELGLRSTFFQMDWVTFRPWMLVNEES